MTYPVRTIVRPSALNGQSNGALSSTILSQIPGQAGGQTITMVKVAARACRALIAAAKAAGHTLKITSAADSYRKYSIQEAIFRDRYTTTYLAGRPYKYWNGRRWYQKPNTAVAAVPGTSNHGWGLANDFGEERDGDAGTEPLDDATLNWLINNEERFGFSHELQSEPWHIRYFAGDKVPQAVLDYEQQLNKTDLSGRITVTISMELPTLKPGDNHPQVVKLQQRLRRDCGQSISDAKGIFGPSTKQAVNNVKSILQQEDPNVKLDGICGPAVWELLAFIALGPVN